MDLYRALNCPVELKNWKSEGGDPCWSAMFPFSCSKLQGFSLPGNLGDQLLSLQHLKNLDLSRNKFSGDLPASFRALNNLTRLNIEDNSEVNPESFQNINNLWIGGNQLHRGVSYPPWKFPTNIAPNEQNMSSPLTRESSSIGKYPSHETADNRNKRPGSGGIVIMVVGAVLSVIGVAVFITVLFQRSQRQSLVSIRGSISSLQSFPISAPQGTTSSLAAQYYSTDSSSSDSPPLVSPWQLPPAPTRTLKMSKRISFAKKCKLPICAKLYTVAELQLATNNFSPANLLGEGTLGSVYRAHFPDGQILAVKNIKTIELSIIEEEQFMEEVIRQASSLRHPNIVALAGYCVGHGNRLFVYEYIRNVTLDDALHNVLCMPLTWSIRLCIAVGIAQASTHLHTSCVPPITHSNLKAANILDEDLNPRICDCGVAVLEPLASNSVKIKASEMAVADSGYAAPEHVKCGSGNPKADIYSFGVLLLELLTGRQPVDSSKPKGEQSLVEWASSKLHDSECLLEMVGPTIRRTISSTTIRRTICSRTTSSYADIISQCIQPHKEFRPQMSEVVQSLVLVLQKSGQEKPKSGKDRTAAEGTGIKPCEKCFRSTNSRFFTSTTASGPLHCAEY